MWRDLLRTPPRLTDALLEGSMATAIEATKLRHALAEDGAWRPGEPLRLLLVGYLGTRNTGADVRVAEMIRQLRAIIGDALELSVLTSDPRLSAGYFPGVRQVRLPDFYPAFLARETARYHGVVACEGSMFKSKFANALTTLMVGALGLASAQNKLSIGYGAEAGDMDPTLRELVRRYCHDSLIVCRNEASRRILAELDVPTAPGTDTAWTFDPEPPERAQARLREAGWDGQTPILAICPINPFWWPVRPALGRTLWDRATGRTSPTHYRAFYHHEFGRADQRRLERYLEALAGAALRFARERAIFPVVVGMERLDRGPVLEVAQRLGGAPHFVSDEHDMFAMVSILREASWLVSSRYHALVCSSPAGVPSVGVSMDERIVNLLDERDLGSLCLGVEDEQLEDRIVDRLLRIERDREGVSDALVRAIPRELERMGEMGRVFERRLWQRYPNLTPTRAQRPWWRYLPPLAPRLQQLLERGAPSSPSLCS